MNQHLFNQVKSIVESQSSNEQVRNTAFSSISNKNTVRAALKKLGYAPNCEACPTVWKLGGFEPPKYSSAVKRSKPKPAKLLKIERKELPGGKLRRNFLAGDTVIISEQSLCRAYVMQIAVALQKEGYRIKKYYNKDKKTIVAYQVMNPIENPEPIVTAKVSKASWLLSKLATDGYVETREFKGAKKYLSKLIWELRALGHDIETIREGKAAVRYQLASQ